jgi:hypothetical protein
MNTKLLEALGWALVASVVPLFVLAIIWFSGG